MDAQHVANDEINEAGLVKLASPEVADKLIAEARTPGAWFITVTTFWRRVLHFVGII